MQEYLGISDQQAREIIQLHDQAVHQEKPLAFQRLALNKVSCLPLRWLQPCCCARVARADAAAATAAAAAAAGATGATVAVAAAAAADAAIAVANERAVACDWAAAGGAAFGFVGAVLVTGICSAVSIFVACTSLSGYYCWLFNECRCSVLTTG